MKTKLSTFNFELPEKLISKYPTETRDESRLMVVHKDSGKIEHKTFKDVIDYFDEDDTMIFNDTKVFPARLFGKKEKTGAQIEVFLLRELNKESRLWDVLVDPARKIRVGNKLYFTDKEDNEILVAEVVDNTTSRGRTIRFFFEGTDEEYHAILRTLGNTPLPKYIDREPEQIDIERYQTVSAADIVNKSIDHKKRICSVGTTSMRTIESAVSATGYLKEAEGWTNLFVYHPYEFSIANSMITNFHLPKSSLVIMVAAFAGHELIMDAYQEAIKKKYRFFSYGDAMLII